MSELPTTPDVNPYASPAHDVAPALRFVPPRRWFWWMLVDGLYMGLCIAIVAAPLTSLGLLSIISIKVSAFPPADRLLIEVLFPLLVCGAQIIIAAMLFGALLALWPRIPLAAARIMVAVIPVVTNPVVVGIAMAGVFSWDVQIVFELVFFAAMSCLATAYALHLTLQSAQTSLEPVTRYAANSPLEVSVKLAVQRWMQRVLEISLPEGKFTLDYDGRKLGSEQVLLDGMEVGRGTSILQLAPKFPFTLGQRRCELHVTGWPWMTLRSLILVVDDQVVYREGW